MPFTGPTSSLEHIADLRVNLAPPIPGGSTPLGIRNWFEITGGTMTSVANSSTPTSPQLSAKIITGGSDYTRFFSEEGVISLDIQMAALSTDSELFHFKNTGFLHFDEANVKVIKGEKDATDAQFGENEIVESITCNTSSETWGWLNFAKLVGQARLVVEVGVLLAFEVRVFNVEDEVG